MAFYKRFTDHYSVKDQLMEQYVSKHVIPNEVDGPVRTDFWIHDKGKAAGLARWELDYAMQEGLPRLNTAASAWAEACDQRD